jgi:hypothetical protein
MIAEMIAADTSEGLWRVSSAGSTSPRRDFRDHGRIRLNTWSVGALA